jgi:hypothetical protein
VFFIGGHPPLGHPLDSPWKDYEMRKGATRAFFGATVRYANAAGAERVVSIVGTDEIDLNRDHISCVDLWDAR